MTPLAILCRSSRRAWIVGTAKPASLSAVSLVALPGGASHVGEVIECREEGMAARDEKERGCGALADLGVIGGLGDVSALGGGERNGIVRIGVGRCFGLEVFAAATTILIAGRPRACCTCGCGGCLGTGVGGDAGARGEEVEVGRVVAVVWRLGWREGSGGEGGGRWGSCLELESAVLK